MLAVTTLGIGTAAAAAYCGRDIFPRHPYPSSTAAPAEGDAIPNVSIVESTIKNYYGSQTVAAPAALTTALGITTMTVPAAQSPYVTEMGKIENKVKSLLAHARAKDGRKAVVFDIDDTLLNTYNYEIYSTFAYNPSSNAAFVNAAAFPADPGMPELFSWVQQQGFAVFLITGRPESQRAATVANLLQAGYEDTFTPANLFLKNTASPPSYLPCGATCTTDQYKSLTRKYIESQGYDILTSIGDQYSDSSDGYTDSRVKLPNPMYFLP